MDELEHRVAVVEAVAVEVGIGPHVLAHRDSNLDATKVHWAHVDPGLEVARLIEDVVGGEQALAVAINDSAAFAQSHRVVQRLAGPGVITIDESGQDPEVVVRKAGNALQLHEVAVDEVRPFEEVAGRITDGGELGEDHEIDQRAPRLLHRHGHGLEVGLEGADGVVKLGDGDTHDELLPRNKDIPSSGHRPREEFEVFRISNFEFRI